MLSGMKPVSWLVLFLTASIFVAGFGWLSWQGRPSFTTQLDTITPHTTSGTPALDQPFTVVVLPDTQVYSERLPEVFCQQTAWIVAQRQTQNIVFAAHLGDIVQNGGARLHEWQTASDCLGQLDGQLPYSVVPGNHDVDRVGEPQAEFQTYDRFFPVSRFAGQPWYRGNYNGNRNSYQVIGQGRQQLLFLNLEVDPPDEVLTWANQTLARYPNTPTILITHVFVEDLTGRRSQRPHFRPTNSAEDIWDQVVAPNCQIKMVWSGHFHFQSGEAYLVSRNRCGQEVHQVLQDYQDREQGGNGRLRLYRFDPAQRQVSVTTFSPVSGELETDADSQFTLSWPGW